MLLFTTKKVIFLYHWCGHSSPGLLRFGLPLGQSLYSTMKKSTINVPLFIVMKICFFLAIYHFSLLSLLNECILVFWNWSWNLFNSHPICSYICCQCHVKWWFLLVFSEKIIHADRENRVGNYCSGWNKGTWIILWTRK